MYIECKLLSVTIKLPNKIFQLKNGGKPREKSDDGRREE